MKSLKTFLVSASQKLTSRKGATMVEYGLILAMIAVVAVAAVQLVGIDVTKAFKALHNVFPAF